jgi:L-ribulokinase
VFEAARAMGRVKDTVYMPEPENVKIYDKLFAEYRLL